MRKLAMMFSSIAERIGLKRILTSMTRWRVVTVSVVLLIVLGAVFLYPLVKRTFWDVPNAVATTPPEHRPSETLQEMTDADLREFAVNDRLPTSLKSHDWVREKIIREALREQLPKELVRRWERDGGQFGRSTSRNSTGINQHWPSQSVLEVTKPGVLGVYFSQSAVGLTITHVHPNGAASRAGLRVGDELLAVNRQRVASQSDLIRQLRAAAAAGGKVHIEILRNSAIQVVQADVSGRTDDMAKRGARRN